MSPLISFQSPSSCLRSPAIAKGSGSFLSIKNGAKK